MKFARKLGMQQSQLSKIVNGLKVPETATIEKLAEGLGVSFSVLVGNSVSVPIVGEVGAGPGRGTESSQPYPRIEVDAEYAANATHAYRVRGDSMRENLIGDDDLILVRQQPDPAPGEIVVVRLGESGEMVVKKLLQGGKLSGGHKVTDADTRYGVLVGVVRKC